MDLSEETLSHRIDSLRAGFAGHHQQTLERNKAYLRAFSPEFVSKLQEHDQWPDALRQSDETGEGGFVSELLRLRGVALGRSGQPDRARVQAGMIVRRPTRRHPEVALPGLGAHRIIAECAAPRSPPHS